MASGVATAIRPTLSPFRAIHMSPPPDALRALPEGVKPPPKHFSCVARLLGGGLSSGRAGRDRVAICCSCCMNNEASAREIDVLVPSVSICDRAGASSLAPPKASNLGASRVPAGAFPLTCGSESQQDVASRAPDLASLPAPSVSARVLKRRQSTKAAKKKARDTNERAYLALRAAQERQRQKNARQRLELDHAEARVQREEQPELTAMNLWAAREAAFGADAERALMDSHECDRADCCAVRVHRWCSGASPRGDGVGSSMSRMLSEYDAMVRDGTRPQSNVDATSSSHVLNAGCIVSSDEDSAVAVTSLIQERAQLTMLIHTLISRRTQIDRILLRERARTRPARIDDAIASFQRDEQLHKARVAEERRRREMRAQERAQCAAASE